MFILVYINLHVCDCDTPSLYCSLYQKLHPKTSEDTGQEVTFLDVYQEFNEYVAEKFKILKFKSRVRKIVLKKHLNKYNYYKVA